MKTVFDHHLDGETEEGFAGLPGDEEDELESGVSSRATIDEVLDSHSQLSKDLKAVSRLVSQGQARYFVKRYYQLQHLRILADGEARAAREAKEPLALVQWNAALASMLEKSMVAVLEEWVRSQQAGRWLRSLCGMGPVLSAGLLAAIDIRRSPTAGTIWRFAGLDPTLEWLGTARAAELVETVMQQDKKPTWAHIQDLGVRLKRRPEGIVMMSLDPATLAGAQAAARQAGTSLVQVAVEKLTKEALKKGLAKRPWNHQLKVLCWRVGDSFVKQSGRSACFYGHVYLERKQLELARNAAGEFAACAAATLVAKRYDPDTQAYKAYRQGKLPDGRIDLRARRYAVKLLLSHLHHVLYQSVLKTDPPKPYVISVLGHQDLIGPPGWPCA